MVSDLIYPVFDYKVKKIDEKPYIFDIIRRKYVFLTPEEWVRQHVLHWLISEKKYSKSLMKIESGLNYNLLKQRTDIVVYDNEAKPFLLVECKASSIQLSEQTLSQALRYNAKLQAPFLMITNGLGHIFVEIKNNESKIIEHIPENFGVK